MAWAAVEEHASRKPLTCGLVAVRLWWDVATRPPPSASRSRSRSRSTARHGTARHLTIVETRPPWREDVGPQWTRFPIARRRHTKTTGLWEIYWRDRNLRFHRYDRAEPTGSRAAGGDRAGLDGDLLGLIAMLLCLVSTQHDVAASVSAVSAAAKRSRVNRRYGSASQAGPPEYSEEITTGPAAYGRPNEITVIPAAPLEH